MTKSEYSGKVSASSNAAGQNINITVDLGKGKGLGPMHLSGDERVPKGVVAEVQTQQSMHANSMGASVEAFANPKQNAYKLGFKEGMKVADFGAGSGAYTMMLANVVGTTGTVYAVDVQRELLTKIQNDAVKVGIENIEIIWGDMETLGGIGIKDELLDGALLSNTLFQVDDKITVLKEIWRVLRPGGILSIIDWTDSFNGLGPKQNAVITQAEATLLCTDNGFAFKNDFKAGEHHYGLNFIKMMNGQTDEQVINSDRRKEDTFITRTISQELI